MAKSGWGAALPHVMELRKPQQQAIAQICFSPVFFTVLWRSKND